MKATIFLLLIILCSCTKESIEPTGQNNVKVSISYGFSSGNITTKGNPLYLNFYNKYLLGKILTPRTYQLIFTSRDSTSFTTTAIGKWSSSNFISLPKGRYRVTGESTPSGKTNATIYTIAGDTCYLGFNDTITITSTTTAITLKALYTCSLILIDTTNVKKAELFAASNYNTGTFKSLLLKTDEYYHTFARDSYLMDRSKYAVIFTLMVTKRNSDIVNLLLWNYFWEAGKYYYFANTNSGYALTPMSN